MSGPEPTSNGKSGSSFFANLSEPSSSSRRGASRGRHVTPRKNRASRSSGFFQDLGSKLAAVQTVHVVNKKTDVPSPRNPSQESDFFSSLPYGAANQTVIGYAREHEGIKVRKSDLDLNRWLGLPIPPRYYVGFNTSLKKFFEDYEAYREQEKKLKDKLCTYKALLKYLTSLDRIKIRWSLNKIAKKILEGHQFERANTLYQKMDRYLTYSDLDDIQALVQSNSDDYFKVLAKIDRDELKAEIEEQKPFLREILKAFSCKKEKEKSIERLTQELALLKGLDHKSVPDIASFFDEKINKINLRLEDLKGKISGIRAKLRGCTNTSEVVKVAQEHLSENSLPKKPKRDLDATRSEAIFVEIARQALRLKDSNGQYNRPLPVRGGSGSVYFVYSKPSESKGRAPLFVFKPYYEAPGMPGNKRENGPEELQVLGGRSLDPHRIAFPPAQGIFREHALSIFFPRMKPQRTLATLKSSGWADESSHGLLMEYVPHLFTLRELADEILAQDYDMRLLEMTKQVSSSASKEMGDGERLGQLKNLLMQIQTLQELRDQLSLRSDKTDMQKKVLEKCTAYLGEEGFSGKISSLPIWSLVSEKSLHGLIQYSLRVPDFDRNAENLLVAEGKPYQIVSIDADQILPDTWQGANPPAWIGSSVCDFVLSESKLLANSIPYFNAAKMLGDLKKQGVWLQEEPAKIFDVYRNKELVVGGDLYNILNAFHVVAKMGLLNENTANQIGHILFDPSFKAKSRLHELFLKAKNADGIHSTQEFDEISKHPLYKKCFNEQAVAGEEEARLWGNFKIFVLEQLNKEKLNEAKTKKNG